MLGGLAALLVAIAVVALAAGGGEDEGQKGAAAPTAVRASDWRELPPAREARQQAPATVQFGTIWLLGGLVGKNSSKATRSVEGFDTAIDQWKGGAPLPVPLHHPLAATYRGRLVVMGGWIPEGDVLSAKSSNRVWELRGERWVPLPPMNSPRVAGGAAVVGGKLVVAGGQNQGRLVATTEVFDGKSWKTVADMPTPREHLGVATDGRYLYAVGGRELAADKNLVRARALRPRQGRVEEAARDAQAAGRARRGVRRRAAGGGRRRDPERGAGHHPALRRRASRSGPRPTPCPTPATASRSPRWVVRSTRWAEASSPAIRTPPTKPTP